MKPPHTPRQSEQSQRKKERERQEAASKAAKRRCLRVAGIAFALIPHPSSLIPKATERRHSNIVLLGEAVGLN